MKHDHTQASANREPHDPDVDVMDMITAQFWDERYGSADSIWSGNPNPHLVAQVTVLTPGSVLEVGSGEGADAIWLAAQGWQVTGTDVSLVGLERAEKHAAAAGFAGQINWQQSDLVTWDPPVREYDLVTAHFIHLPQPLLRQVHRQLAGAVRSGGSLLIVGHHPSDAHVLMRSSDMLDLLFTAQEVAQELDPSEWDVVMCAAPERTITDADGEQMVITDAVLRAVRR